MSNTLNIEFEKRVKTLVEGLGYALNVEFDSTGKKAYLMSISELTNAFSKDEQNKVMPYAVITFCSSKDINTRDMALALYDSERKNSGEVKLIGYTLDCDGNIPYIQNLVYHDTFPGEDYLKVPMYDDDLDYLEAYWDDYVQKVSYKKLKNNHYSWFPNDYSDLPEKEGFELRELGTFETAYGESYDNIHSHESALDCSYHRKGPYAGKVVLLGDLKSSYVDYKLVAGDISSNRKGEGEYYIVEDKEVIVVSVFEDDLKPTLIDASGDIVYVPLSEMSVIDLNRMKEFDAKYLVKELQKDYVVKQIENKYRGGMDDRYYILNLVKIYVPLESNGLSSIERQKMCAQKAHIDYVRYLEEELKKERFRYIKKYERIYNYYKDKELNRTLQELLINFEKNEISDKFSFVFNAGQLVEGVKKEPPACLNKYKDITELSSWSYTISKNDLYVPEYIKRSLHLCIRLRNIEGHPNEKEKRAIRNAPYIVESVMYSLLNILYWCVEEKKKDNNA